MPKKTPKLQLVSAGGEAKAAFSTGLPLPHPPATLDLPEDELITVIRQRHRKRDMLMRSAGDATRRIKSACMRAAGFNPQEGVEASKEKRDHADAMYKELSSGNVTGIAAEVYEIVDDLLVLRQGLEDAVKRVEKEVIPYLKQTKAHDFVENAKGFGLVGLMQIIGEAGDLSNYSNPGKLWKRFGLAPYGGKAGSTWRAVKTGGLKAEEWTMLGYSLKRRSTMFVIADSLIKAKGPYRDLYLTRLAVEHGKAVAEGLIPASSTAVTVKSWADRGLPTLKKVTKVGPDHRSADHMNKRAMRYVGKRLLRDLWRAWTGKAKEWKAAA